jgi:hypothetical protein
MHIQTWSHHSHNPKTTPNSVTKTTLKKPQNGAPGAIRTRDPRLRRPLLYPAELRVRSGFTLFYCKSPNITLMTLALKLHLIFRPQPSEAVTLSS